MSERLRAWLADFRAAYSYVRDPHGWELQIRWAAAAKLSPRPAIYQAGDSFIVHPALEHVVRQKLAREASPEPWRAWPLWGLPIYVSEHCVEQPPEGGWPDVKVPQRPRLRP